MIVSCSDCFWEFIHLSMIYSFWHCSDLSFKRQALSVVRIRANFNILIISLSLFPFHLKMFYCEKSQTYPRVENIVKWTPMYSLPTVNVFYIYTHSAFSSIRSFYDNPRYHFIPSMNILVCTTKKWLLKIMTHIIIPHPK